MQRFTDLKVWQRGHALVLEIYKETSGFPSEERYGLTSQLRRAALSIPTNIAEGSKRRSNQEYAHFLNIAEGSLAEAEYLIMVSRDLSCMAEKVAQRLLSEVAALAGMLHALRLKVAVKDNIPSL